MDVAREITIRVVATVVAFIIIFFLIEFLRQAKSGCSCSKSQPGTPPATDGKPDTLFDFSGFGGMSMATEGGNIFSIKA